MNILTVDRRAYLHWIRNVRRGLATRTAILRALERDQWLTASEISTEASVTSSTISYHLRNMERENIVARDPEGSSWRLGDFNQKILTDYMRKGRKKVRKKRSKNM